MDAEGIVTIDRECTTALLVLIAEQAQAMKDAEEAGDAAAVDEEQGEAPARSSDAWYQESDEHKVALYALLERREKRERGE